MSGKYGLLDLPKLLDAFQQFFRENGDCPQLLMQTFPHRASTAVSASTRRQAEGIRVGVQRSLDETQGSQGPVQQAVIKLKILHKSLEVMIARGLNPGRRLYGSGWYR